MWNRKKRTTAGYWHCEVLHRHVLMGPFVTSGKPNNDNLEEDVLSGLHITSSEGNLRQTFVIMNGWFLLLAVIEGMECHQCKKVVL